MAEDGVIKGGSARLGAIVFSIFAGLWMFGVLAITALGWSKMVEEPVMMAVMGLFWAAGLFLTTLAVRAVLQALRFPASALTLDAMPLPLGGWASGVIRGPVAVHGAEVVLAVECIRTSGTGRSRRTTLLWSVNKLLDGNRFQRGADSVEIPFAVQLPSTLQATAQSVGGVKLFGGDVTLGGTSDIDWYVSASAKLPGVDWEERFPVPVAVAPPGTTADSRPPREMPELTGERLDAHLPGRFEVGADADVLHFPLKPSFILWPVGLGAVALFLPLARDLRWLSGFSDDAIFWARVVSAAVALLSLVGLLLDTRRVEVRPDAVRIRRGLFGVGFHATLPREQIAAVDETTSGTNPPLFLVKLRLRTGKSYDVAPNIYYQPEKAGALAARLRAILQVG